MSEDRLATIESRVDAILAQVQALDAKGATADNLYLCGAAIAVVWVLAIAGIAVAYLS